VAVRAQPRRNTVRALDAERELHPLTPFFRALQAEKIPFLIIGMSAAIMQGAPGSTLDYDIWINLPTRQYMRVINIAHRLGAELFSNQSIALNGLSVDLVYQPHGLKSFRTELRGALWLEWQGVKLPVLPLERIIAAKEFIGRDKDLAQLPILRNVLRQLRRRKS
jgi:hypothetical protein